MTMAWHVADRKNLQSIQTEGLRERSYWAILEEVRDYYQEVIADEGGSPMVLSIPLDQLMAYHPEPDFPGLEEPLTYTLGVKEDEVWKEWEETDGSVEACMDLIGSFRLVDAIPAEALKPYLPEPKTARRRPSP